MNDFPSTFPRSSKTLNQMTQFMSEADEQKREAAKKAVSDIEQELQSNKITPQDAITKLSELERIHRLQADAVSSPFYAEAVIKLLCKYETPEKVLDEFNILYKSRLQCKQAQEFCTNIVRDSFFSKNNIWHDTAIMEKFASIIRGSIAVESTYIEVQIQQMENLIAIGKIEDAAQIAEQLQTDTAIQIPLLQRLKFILQQIKCLNQLGDQVRNILIFQKFNLKAVKNEINTTVLASSKETEIEKEAEKKLMQEINDIISAIYIEMSSAYDKANQLDKAAWALLQSVIHKYDRLNAEIALYYGFCAQNQAVLDEISGIFEKKHIKTYLYDEIIKQKTIQSIEVYKQHQKEINCDVKRLIELEEMFIDGFIRYQFGKLKKVISGMSFEKFENFVGVPIERLEKILVEIETEGVEIDRVAKIIKFKKNANLYGSTNNIKGIVQKQVQSALQLISNISYAIFTE